MILPIGGWAFQTAAIQAAKLHQSLKRIVPIGVNVSAKQFKPVYFVYIIDEDHAIDGVSPEILENECNEGTFIEDISLND